MEATLLGSARSLLFMSVLGLALVSAQARAQENLDRGRTPAQLYASDCAECHRNPKVVGRNMSAGSLAGYLREHYTASKESAAALAGYLSAMAPEPAARKPAATSAKPSTGKPPASREPGKGAEGQSATPTAKSSQVKPSQAKPADPANAPKPPTSPEAPAAKPPESDAKPPPSGEGPK
jgi:hypothetical protein